MITRIVSWKRPTLPSALFALLIGLASFLQSAWAQTPVSGAIAVDTLWTAENGPYLVSGNLVVQSGATLTIAPGVTVYMAPASSLTVQSGSVKAIGTAGSRIRVSSDSVRTSQPASQGNFGSWVFNPGSSDVHLEHLIFEYGSGIQVRGSSPTFNYLDLRHNLGPAISIDLASSPSGVGNQAVLNGVNGIDVPAGDVTAVVNWGILGIPYVVRSGTVSVGQTPTISSLAPNTLQQGQTSTIEVVGARLDGAIEALFGDGISAEVLPGGSATRASLNVTAGDDADVGAADLRMLVDAGYAHSPAALTITQSQPTITSLQPDRVFVGQGDAQIAVSGRGFTPESVAELNGAGLTTDYVGPGHLNVLVPNHTAAANKTLRLRTPDPLASGEFLLSNEVVLPILPAQIQVSPAVTQVVSGRAHPFSVALPYPAAAGGVQVTLVSSVPSVGTVPSSLTVAAGEQSAAFELAAIANGSTVITASRAGLISGQSTVTVTPPPTLAISPSNLTIGVGRSADITVTSSMVAGADGLVVDLASSGSSAQVAPQVVIPAGSSSTVATVATSTVGEVTLTATAVDHVAATATVHVRPVSINLPAATVVAPGLTRSIPVTLSEPAPTGGLELTLQSTNVAVATAPASLSIPEGETASNFQLTGVAAGTTSVSASGPGYEQGVMAVAVESIQIRVGSPAVSGIAIPAEQIFEYPITLSRPAPAGGVVVALSTADPNVATVEPAQINIASGETSGGTVSATLSALVPGNTSLVASSEGLESATVPVTVRNKAALHFSSANEVVGKGLSNYSWSIHVYRTVDDQWIWDAGPLTVSLTSSDPSRVSVPATVTIPAGQSHVYFQITGVDFTNGAPVTIDATAEGHTAPTAKLQVTTVEPTLTFSSLDHVRGAGSSRDNFNLYARVPGAIYPDNAVAAADLTFDLTIVNAAPSGIVPGIYEWQTGGEAVSQTILRAGSNHADTRYVGTPTSAGTYQVRARAAGVAEGLSSQVSVSAPELQFSQTSEVVGKGLTTYYWSIYLQRVAGGQWAASADPVTVTLTSSDPSKVSVPSTVTIPANDGGVYVQVTGVDLTNGTPVTIDAAAEGHSAPATKLTVTTIAPTLMFSGLDSVRSAGSARDDFQIYARVPGAIYPNNATATTDLTFDLSIVDATPSDIVSGFFEWQTGGASATQMFIRAGSTYSDVRYVGTPTAAGSYRVRAHAAGITEATSDEVSVTAPALQFSRSTEVVGKGFTAYPWSVYLQRVVGGQQASTAEALTVTLTSSDPSKVSVPSTVTIPANNSGVYVQLTGVDLTNGTPVTIDAVAEGHTAPATKLTVTTVAPTFWFSGLDTVRSAGSSRDDFQVYATVPGASYASNASAATDLTLNLSVVNASPSGIVPGFFSSRTGGAVTAQTIMRTGTNYADTRYVGTPTSAGSYRVRAQATGFGEATSSQVSVNAPALRFSIASEVIGKGFQNYPNSVYIQRVVDGQQFNGAEPLTVTLKCSSVVICAVPPSVVIPAESSYAGFSISGLALGSTTVSAEAAGHTSALDLDVSVVRPALRFTSVPSWIGAGSTGTVWFGTHVPGAYYAYDQIAISPVTINLTSSVPGVATVTETLTIPAGSSYSEYGTITAVSPGTTTVTASGTDLQPVTSSTITVSP